MAKKKLGILGGMGSRAGAMLFDQIVTHSPAARDQDFIEVILHNNSAVPDRTRAIVYHEQSPLPELRRSIALFNDNGVEVVAIACVTAHYFYDEIRKYSNAQVLHPVQLVKEHLLRRYPHVSKAGLLATTGTLQSGLFQRVMQDSGIGLVTLSDEEQETLFMQSVYMPRGLKSSPIAGEAMALFLRTIPCLLDRGAQVIIGGCSEVQIALQDRPLPVPYVDAMDVLAKEAIRVCYGLPEPAAPLIVH